jgi:hypothetical protein
MAAQVFRIMNPSSFLSFNSRLKSAGAPRVSIGASILLTGAAELASIADVAGDGAGRRTPRFLF